MRDRIRFRIEVVAAVAFAVSLIATVVDPEWIEALFGVDPDHGNGSLEWLISATLLLVCIVLALSARRTWQRLKIAS